MEFKLPVIPVPKGRPRVTRRGITYTPARTKNTMNAIQVLMKAHPDCPSEPLSDPVSVSMTFFMPIAKSWSKKRKEESLGECHVSRGDVDNFAKLVMDALNGILWVDDQQIWQLTLQ